VTKETSVTRPRLARAPDQGPPEAASAADHTFPLAFPKDARILRRAEFRAVYDNGIRLPNHLFAAFCLAHTATPRAAGRLGITIPRAVGKAVERNRIKRRLREAFRLHRAELDPRWDIVLNPRRPALTAAFADVERAILKLIERCNARVY